MSYVRTMIKAVDSNEEECGVYLPSKIIRDLKIPAVSLTIAFGNHQTQAMIGKREQGASTQMTASLLQTLRLPTGTPILMRYDAAEQRLVFGPYIGVLLSKLNPANSHHPFAAITTFLDEVADIFQKQGGVVSVFTPNDIYWDSHTVRAMIRKGKVWRMHTLPLPQSIYNRLPTRQYEQKETVGETIQRFKDFHIPFFNEKFLNKWHVHEALAGNPAMQAYLPKTIRMFGAYDLKQMLSEHKMVYVKPTSGSMGKGIYRVFQSSNGYQLQYATMNGSVTRTHKEFSPLYQSLKKRIQGKSYLIQQGIALIGINRRPADFRVLVQKNGQGEWAVTSLVARVGQNSIVSNVARGGMMTSAEQALQISGPWQASVRPTPQSLKYAALEISRELEKTINGHYAELGIDLGVDVTGRIWLLEVNSKPSKSDNTVQRPEGEEVSATRKIRPSVRRLYDYSAFLAGFAPIKRSTTAKPKKMKRKGQRR